MSLSVQAALITIVLEAGKSKIRALADAGSGESPLPVSHTAVSSHSRKGEGALGALFAKGTNPVHEGSILMT